MYGMNMRNLSRRCVALLDAPQREAMAGEVASMKEA